MSGHAKGPWLISDLQVGFPDIEINDADGFAIVRVLWSKTQKENMSLIAAAPTMLGALRQWKCPGCGGVGQYQQNAKGRARDEARGRKVDLKFTPDPVVCKVCNGDGLNPIASHAINQATKGTQP